MSVYPAFTRYCCRRVLLLAALPAILLAGCGYKGQLYLPHEGDDARFGPVQTGIGLDKKPPAHGKDAAKTAPNRSPGSNRKKSPAAD